MLKSLKFIDVNVDVSSVCNFRCSFCANAIRDQKTKKFMDIEMFELLLVKLIESMRFVNIHIIPTNGEFFLHPNLERIMELICFYKNVTFTVMTNGFSIPLDYLNYISTIPNLTLIVSVYGEDFEEFSQITNSPIQEDQYNLFIQNLPNLIHNGVELAFRSYRNTSGIAFGIDMKKFQRMKTMFFDWRSYPKFNKREFQDTMDYFNNPKICERCSSYGTDINISPLGFINPCSCVDYTNEFHLAKLETTNDNKKLKVIQNVKNISNFINNIHTQRSNRMCSCCEYPLNCYMNNWFSDNVVGTNDDRNDNDKVFRILNTLNVLGTN